MSGIFILQAVICLSLYFILIFTFFIGWLRTKIYKPDAHPPLTPVTILIPCRNEEQNIPELAALLNNQDYPDEQLEIIWIDDHSGDRSDQILSDLIQSNRNNKRIRLSGQTTGKKEALKAGMGSASGSLILLTDADSRPGTRWVKTMSKFFEDSGCDLVLGPVLIDPANTVFNQVQKLEYLSLVASSVGAAGIGRPILAQGPNIAVRAADYRNIVYDLDNRFVSGDDVFLLQSMRKIPGKRIGFVLNPDANITSKPAGSLHGFLHQRLRWASKATGYRDPFLILTTLLVFAANLEILAALVLALCAVIPYSLVLAFLGIKILADLPLLFTAVSYFHCQKILIWLVPVQLLYPVYVTVAGILSQVAPVRWR